MKPARDHWIKNRWPLIEKYMTRNDCLKWMDKKGYQLPPRSSCSFCPYHSNHEWKRLKDQDPEAFIEAIDFERKFQQTMKNVKGFRGTAFLHRSCVPLEQVDFDPVLPQMDMFGDECEGMCGV